MCPGCLSWITVIHIEKCFWGGLDIPLGMLSHFHCLECCLKQNCGQKLPVLHVQCLHVTDFCNSFVQIKSQSYWRMSGMHFGCGVVIRDIDKNRLNYIKKTKIWARTGGKKHLGSLNQSFGERKVLQKEKWQQLQEYKFILQG